MEFLINLKLKEVISCLIQVICWPPIYQQNKSTLLALWGQLLKIKMRSIIGRIFIYKTVLCFNLFSCISKYISKLFLYTVKRLPLSLMSFFLNGTNVVVLSTWPYQKGAQTPSDERFPFGQESIFSENLIPKLLHKILSIDLGSLRIS